MITSLLTSASASLWFLAEDEEELVIQTADTAFSEAFLVISIIAVVGLLLIFDMVRRMRRTRYREQVRAELAVEIAERDGLSGQGSQSNA